MSTETQYGLIKPSPDDFYDVEVQNTNMDIIDGLLDDVYGTIGDTNSDIDNHKNASNPHNITPSKIGLNNVDNTSDIAKPVSTAQAAAIAKAKEEANATALNYIQNAMTGHRNENIHVTSAERASWNANITAVNGLTEKTNEQGFELIKTQNITFNNVPTTEGEVNSFTEITGIDVSRYKELVFAISGTITLADISTNVSTKYRTSILEFYVFNRENESSEISQEIAKLYNTKSGPVTLTMDFNVRIRIKTDICKHEYIQGSGTEGYHYYGLSMQSLKNAFDGVTLTGHDFGFKISHSATTAGTAGNAVANVVGSVSVYGKRGL